MSELLNKAIARVKKLPEFQQNEIAAMILEELEDEARWDKAFSSSQDLLANGVRKDNEIIWFWIGSHSDYDKLLSQL